MNRLRVLGVAFLLAAMLAGCSVLENGIHIQDDGQDIVRIDKSGFLLDGHFTSVSLDKDGLQITYPSGGLSLTSEGLDIEQGDSTVEVRGDRIEIVDGDGERRVLETEGKGSEYRSDDGAVVATGEKAVLPDEYPSDLLPLMEGFTLTATANLGDVLVVSGYVLDTTVQDVVAAYQDILLDGDSFRQEKKAGMVLLRATFDGRDISVYIADSLQEDTVNYTVVVGKDEDQ